MDDSSEIDGKVKALVFQLVQKCFPKPNFFRKRWWTNFFVLYAVASVKKYLNIKLKHLNLTPPSESIKKVSEEDRQQTIYACRAWVIEDPRSFNAVEGTGFPKMIIFFFKLGHVTLQTSKLMNCFPIHPQFHVE